MRCHNGGTARPAGLTATFVRGRLHCRPCLPQVPDIQKNTRQVCRCTPVMLCRVCETWTCDALVECDGLFRQSTPVSRAGNVCLSTAVIADGLRASLGISAFAYEETIGHDMVSFRFRAGSLPFCHFWTRLSLSWNWTLLNTWISGVQEREAVLSTVNGRVCEEGGVDFHNGKTPASGRPGSVVPAAPICLAVPFSRHL